MPIDILRPSPRYVTRLYVLLTLGGIVFLAFGIVLAWFYAISWEGTILLTRTLQIYIMTILVGYLLSLWIANRFSQNLFYELGRDSITLHRGFWRDSGRQVDLRRVVGLTLKRDFLDRWLEIGTLEFILLDLEGNNPGVVRLVGIPDVNDGYRKISVMLMRFWGEQLLRSNQIEGKVQVAIENPFNFISRQQTLNEFKQ